MNSSLQGMTQYLLEDLGACCRVATNESVFAEMRSSSYDRVLGDNKEGEVRCKQSDNAQPSS